MKTTTHVLIFIAVALGAIEALPQSSATGRDTSLIPVHRAVVATGQDTGNHVIAKALCPIWTMWTRGVQELSVQRSFERGEPQGEVAI